MKKVGLLVLVMLVFAQLSSTAADYSKMSAKELNEALIIAVKKGSSDEAQKLIRAGANVNQKITYDAGLRDWDVDVTCTLLEYAAKEGYVDIVKELLQANPKIDEINQALILSAENGKANVVRELLQAKPKADTINKAFILSAKKGYPNAVRELLQAKPEIDVINTALILSAENGKANVVRELVKAGANVNHADECGNTALIGLIGCSLYKATEAYKKNRVEVIQDLLKEKANVNHANKTGDTALIRAIQNHDLDAVQILLKTPGININYANNNGNTALIIALQCIQYTYVAGNNEQYNDCLNSQKILEKLLEIPGINLHHVNKNGDTAIKLIKKINERMNY